MKKEDFINTKWDARDWTPEGLSWWLSAMRELGIILVTEPSKRISPRFFIIRDEYIAFTDNKSHYDSRAEKEMKLESILPQHVKHLEGQRAKARFDSALDKQEGGDHYKSKAIQPVEYNHANGLGFLEGNVIKYVTRHKEKNGLQDIEKAIHYLELIKQLEYGQ